MQADPGDGEVEAKRASGPRAWIAESKDHPLATAALVFCILGGAILAGTLMPESISWPRRVLGGATAADGAADGQVGPRPEDQPLV